MKKNITRLLPLLLLLSILSAEADEDKKILTPKKQTEKSIDISNENELDKIGFFPALFIVHYDEEILSDSKDVKIRGDGTVSSKGTKYSVTMGVELHYNFSFRRKYDYLPDEKNPLNMVYKPTSSHRLSPFIGLFDIENGINGMVFGIIYGYTKGDGEQEGQTTLNFGIGKSIHKNRLVLASDIKEGDSPPAGLTVDDYTERKDVKGLSLMVSANFGF